MKYVAIAFFSLFCMQSSAMEPESYYPESHFDEIIRFDPLSQQGALMMTACTCSMITVFISWDALVAEDNE